MSSSTLIGLYSGLAGPSVERLCSELRS